MSRHFWLIAIAAAMLPVSAGLAVPAAHAVQQPNRTPTPRQPATMDVVWDEVRADARTESVQRQRAQTTPEQALTQPRNMDAQAMGEMEVPVLVPSNASLRLEETPVVLIFPRRDYYTLSVMGEGVTIEVFCTRLAHTQAANARTDRLLRGSGPEGYRSDRTEYGREISFNRYGVAYSVTIECDDPERDLRCTAPEYGQQIMQSLQVLPGSRGAQGGG